MRDIEKSYGSVPVLKKVNFTLRRGEVHALVGENGAGKSTLIKILMGIVPKNGGTVVLDGRELKLSSPHEAAQNGIAAIFQELSLVPTLTVAENVFLCKEPTRGGLLTDRRRMREETQRILDRYGIDLNPDEKVAKLSMARRQIAEAVKAIAITPKLLVMDEPTSTLSKAEADALFQIIGRLREEGTSIIYISHRMDEIFRLADRITVLRDGVSVLTDEIANLDFDKVVTAMVGREISHDDYAARRHRDFSDAPVVLDVRGLGDGKRFSDVSFRLRRGEILGFAGLVGSGRTELMQLLFGIERFKTGQVLLEGEELKNLTVNRAIARGIAMVPESRQLQGIVAIHSIEDNIALAVLDRISDHGVENRKKKSALARRFIDELRIKTESEHKKLSQLSGGNQQKVVIAKWLAAEPKVLILDEPTAGIDVQAKDEVHHLIRSLSEQGISILLVSSEMPELLNNSDRIVVMNDFRIIAEYQEATQEEIMSTIMRDKANRRKEVG